MVLPWIRRGRSPGLTYAADVDGDIHVAVLGAVVHGLLQGLQLGLAVAAGAERSCCRVGQVRPLGQDLLQRQDIALLLLRLSKQLAENVPVNHGMTDRGREGRRGEERESRVSGQAFTALGVLAVTWQVRTPAQEITPANGRTS